MEESVYKEAIKNTECAFAYHKAVFDEQNKMVDYIFLDVNESFEKMTGLKKENILNKQFLKEVSQDKKNSKKWIGIYEEVVSKQTMIEFEEYSEEFRSHYYIRAYSTDKKHFTTLFLNKTSEKKVQDIAKYYINNIGDNIDYNKISKLAYEISGGYFVALNLFDAEGRDFTTVAACGMPNSMNRALELLHFELVGKKWKHDPVREEKIKDKDITRFDKLSELTGNIISKKAVTQVEKIFNLGSVIVAKIDKEGKVIGDFTILFKKGQELKNKDLFMLFLSQTGLFVQKTLLEESLSTSQKRFYVLAEYAPVGFVSCNLLGEITYANKKLLEILDSPSYEATSKFNLLHLPSLKNKGFSEKLSKCMKENREIVYEMDYKSMWGKETWLKVYYSPVNERGKVIGANVLVEDITDRKFYEDELKAKAERDPLTKAYNRNALETVILKRLGESKDKSLISCIAIVDIDNFKAINDNYGHKAGDSILKHMAYRVKRELRGKDVLIRTGGDEFLVYLHDIKNKENASKFIKRIFDKISSDYRITDNNDRAFTLYVGCSIGVSFFPKDGLVIAELVSRADAALYKVKNSGKANFSLY